MPELHVSPVESDADLNSFITFPWSVYRADPNWVPPLISERRELVDPEKNPFFEHARARYFLARRGDGVVGTISAISNDLYNSFQGVNVGFFGFFEVLDDPEAATALLKAAEDWVRQAGHTSVLGPAQFSTNDEVGLLVDGFNDPPRLLMTYNPKRYQDYIEGAGYVKAMDLWAYSLATDILRENIPPKVFRVTEKIGMRRNLRVRKLAMKDFDREVDRLKEIYNTSWERNWGFVPMTEDELNYLAKKLKPFLDPDLAVFVEQDDKPIAFGIGLPDLNAPLRLAYPRPGVPEAWTILKLFWHWRVRKKVDWLRVWALGILPEYRGLGIDSLVYLDMAKTALAKRFKWVEMSWILEDNAMMNRGIQLMGGEVYKTYRVYEKRL